MGIDPVTMAIASFAFQAFSAVRGFQQDKAAAKQQERANEAARQQAQVEADLARRDAEFAAEQERDEARRLRGQQIAQFMANGVSLEGTPLLTISETEEKGEENAQNTIDNAEARARSLILQGEASQRPVTKPDIFGTAATVLGAGANAQKAYNDSRKRA